MTKTVPENLLPNISVVTTLESPMVATIRPSVLDLGTGSSLGHIQTFVVTYLP